MGTYTTNLNLYKPAVGETGWGTLVDANFDTLDNSAPQTSGLWTPSVGGSATYTVQTGLWTKLGHVMVLSCTLRINVLGSGSSTVILGAPTVSTGIGTGAVRWQSAVNTLTSCTAFIDAVSSSIVLYSTTAAAASSSTVPVLTDSTLVYFTLVYPVT